MMIKRIKVELSSIYQKSRRKMNRVFRNAMIVIEVIKIWILIF